MCMPGFTAEASLVKSSERYLQKQTLTQTHNSVQPTFLRPISGGYFHLTFVPVWDFCPLSCANECGSDSYKNFCYRNCVSRCPS